MDKCKDCKYYDDILTFPNSGLCIYWDEYVKENDNCENFREE